MTITQILKQFDKASLTTISKLTIRELEEEKKGHWVAYVDEGNESYDVHVKFLGKQVDFTSCDCGVQEDQLCAHKTKMLLMLDDKLKGKKVVDKPVAKKTLSKKKVSESEILLRASDQEIVYEWLIKTFASNKVLEQDFILSFSAPECKEYTVNDVVSIVKTIASSSFKVKRNADANTVKEFIRLLNLAIEPIEKFTVFNITKPLALDIYLCIIEEVLTLKRGVKTTSTRLNTFVEKLIEKYALSLLNVNDKDAVNRSISSLFKKIKDENNYERCGFLLLILQSIYKLSDSDIKYYCAEESILLVKKLDKHRGPFYSVILFLLNVVLENKVFNQCYNDFICHSFDNETTITLLKELVPIDVTFVIDKCELLINTNNKLESTQEYRKILISIYEERNDVEKLVKLKKESFLVDFKYDDYIYILENTHEKTEWNKFRYKAYDKMKYKKYTHTVFYQIMCHENNIKKMLEYIVSTYQVIVCQYKEILYNYNPAEFLIKVFRLGQYSHYDEEDNIDLANYIASKYSKDAIFKVYKDYKSYSSSCLNKLIVELAENK
ncbi:hypothetical protein HX071_11885 [Myroides marinus]|uniref:SWIM-type domain-containing protein n=1 Tax=Myroides marinus TaxID=703342 RepID=A0A1H6X1D8_9FLAO|nr:hypothetical protein [Myroides marinus]MDM1502894.1 hypothetical protein [Myroides marinus]SEJ21956.1 hypothetical protein SAMN04488018_11735 [Myroides marinus]